MKKIIYLCSILLSLLLVGNVYASMNPVSWQLSPASGFPAQTQVGNSYSVTYTLTNNLPVPLPITVTKTYTGNTITIDDGCSNHTLAANGGICTIYAGIQPARTGVHTLQFTMQYGYNKVQLPALSTTAIPNATSDNIEGYVTTPLPPSVTEGHVSAHFYFYK